MGQAESKPTANRKDSFDSNSSSMIPLLLKLDTVYARWLPEMGSHDSAEWERAFVVCSLPGMLRSRILNEYGPYARREERRLLDWQTKHLEEEKAPPVAWPREDWQEFCRKIDRELRYSTDSQELPESWRIGTPCIDMLKDICAEKTWNLQLVRELLGAYAYPGGFCFKSHLEIKETHVCRFSLKEIIQACDWWDLGPVINRDLILLEMLFPEEDEERALLQNIVVKVGRTYFDRKTWNDLGEMKLRRKAVNSTLRKAARENGTMACLKMAINDWRKAV